MPDQRAHRGAHPEDDALFAPAVLPALREAVLELSWLLSRGYSEASALKLVGDRHALRARQRMAVLRSACTDAQRALRLARALSLDAIADREIDVDGFNALIVTESALSGGLVLAGRDGAHRDLASVHGTWRRVSETAEAIDALGALLAPARVVRWWLDRPVGNSGRLRALLAERAEQHGWPWEIDLVDAPDRVLAVSSHVVATADAWILDRAEAWIDLPGVIARARGAWRVDLAF